MKTKSQQTKISGLQWKQSSPQRESRSYKGLVIPALKKLRYVGHEFKLSLPRTVFPFLKIKSLGEDYRKEHDVCLVYPKYLAYV